MTNSVLRIARVVLEAVTPLSITTGAGDRLFDTTLVRDGWGLPAIPSSGLKGALRALWRESHPGSSQQERALFGFTEGRDGAPARLTLSWGIVHDADDRPAEVAAPETAKDAKLSGFLERLRQLAGDEPLVRQRVRLTDEGVADADGRGQFDRTILPAGLRFTVECSFFGTADEAAAFEGILALFRDPMLRVGGATRSGLGRLTAIRASSASYDLADRHEAEAYRSDRNAIAKFKECSRFRALDLSGLLSREDAFTRSLELRARDLWRIGGGEGLLPPDQEVDLGARPLVEPAVRWPEGKQGTFSERLLVIPGSAVKGALRHRTVFHYRAMKKLFHGVSSESIDPEAKIAELFGSVRKGDSGAGTTGRRGRLAIDDTFVTPTGTTPSISLKHNSIDRFSGGVRDGLLFDEEVAGPADATVRISIEPGADTEVLQAFERALDDLRRGWLPLGAGSRSGHGIFDAEPSAC